MISINANKLNSFAGSLTLAGLLFAGPISAAPVTYTFDFTSGGTDSFWDSTGTQEAKVTSWSDTGTGSTLEAATTNAMTSGLGACNSTEGSGADCTGNFKRAGLDSYQNNDWVLLTFSETMDLSTLTISPETQTTGRQQGRDITYFTGWLDSATDIATASYTDLTAAESSGGLGLRRFDVSSGKGTSDVTLTLADYSVTPGEKVWGNAILIGASEGGGNNTVLLNGMTTVVPVPAAAWLFISAIISLVARRKIETA